MAKSSTTAALTNCTEKFEENRAAIYKAHALMATMQKKNKANFFCDKNDKYYVIAEVDNAVQRVSEGDTLVEAVFAAAEALKYDVSFSYKTEEPTSNESRLLEALAESINKFNKLAYAACPCSCDEGVRKVKIDGWDVTCLTCDARYYAVDVTELPKKKDSESARKRLVEFCADKGIKGDDVKVSKDLTKGELKALMRLVFVEGGA